MGFHGERSSSVMFNVAGWEIPELAMVVEFAGKVIELLVDFPATAMMTPEGI